jgi:hypothetical protein
MASSSLAPDQALRDLLVIMQSLLLQTPGPPGIPNDAVSIASVTERALAVGNWRGNDRRGPLAGVALKGGRLDAVVRFQFWGSDPTTVETASSELLERLMARKEEFREKGLLQIKAENTAPIEPVVLTALTEDAWRKTSDYRVLYEFHFEDTDGASSLISTIPVAIDNQFGESMTITDDMVRWDKTGAHALVIRGPFNLVGLTALAFIPGAVPTGTVTLTRTFDGAAGAPTTHPTLAAFLVAVTGGNPERHALVTFPTVSSFLTAFTSAGDPVEMGAAPDKYSPLTLAFIPGIDLPAVADHFDVTFLNPPFDQLAVVYLRATR